MIGIGLIIPVLPDIVRRFVSDSSLASQAFGVFVAIYAVMQFLFSPLLGMISDRYGRRPVLLVSLCVAAIDYLIMAFAPNLWILFLGRIIAGATGANFTVAMAYIADISSEEKRAANFGMVGAAFGLGFIIGPAIGGLLAHYGAATPFIAAAILNAVNFFFGLFILPESLAPELRKKKMDFKQLNPLGALMRTLKMPGLLPLLAAHFCFQLAGQTHPSIWTLYTEHRFNWTPAQVGISLTVVGLLSAIAQGFLTRILIPKMGEYRAVFYSMVGAGLGYFLYGSATEAWMLYVVLVGTFIFWIGGPALASLVTASGTANAQGELQGSLVSLTSLSAILNPLIATQLFAYFTSAERAVEAPGAPYFFAAVVSLVGALIVFLDHRKRAAPKD